MPIQVHFYIVDCIHVLYKIIDINCLLLGKEDVGESIVVSAK